MKDEPVKTQSDSSFRLCPASFRFAVVSSGIGLAWLAWFLVGGWQVRDWPGTGEGADRLGTIRPGAGPACQALDMVARAGGSRVSSRECEARLGRPDAAAGCLGAGAGGLAARRFSGPGPGSCSGTAAGPVHRGRSRLSRRNPRRHGGTSNRGSLGPRQVAALGRAARRGSPGARRDLARRTESRSDRRAPRTVAARFRGRRGRRGAAGRWIRPHGPRPTTIGPG